MLPLRTRIFILISLAVFAVLALAIFLTVLNKKKTEVEETGKLPEGGGVVKTVVLSDGKTIVTNPIEQGLTPKKPTTLEAEKNSVIQLARIFVERYNSYSSESDFQNLFEVKGLVTEQLWQRISGPIGRTAATGTFAGITTQVFSSQFDVWKEAAASVKLVAKIEEDKNGTVTERSATVIVELSKHQGQWLVEKFTWQK